MIYNNPAKNRNSGFSPDFVCPNPVLINRNRIFKSPIRFLSTGNRKPEFLKAIPVSYQLEPEFRLSTGIPVLNPVPVVP